MKKITALLLSASTFFVASTLLTPNANAQCKPNLMRSGLLRKVNKGGYYKISGQVVNRSKRCTAQSVWAILRINRELEQVFVGSLSPGEEGYFEHVYILEEGKKRAAISLKKFIHD